MIKRIIHRIKKHWEHKAMILMYHRVDETWCDPWELVVSPDNFDAQLQYLKTNFPVVSMDKLISAVSRGNIQKRMIALTFDDGYLDNFTNAAHLLEKHNLPATFFITTNGIGTNDQFWWDELQDYILLNHKLPQRFDLTIENQTFNFQLDDESVLNQDIINQLKQWNAEQQPINKRAELYFSIWQILRACEPSIRKNHLIKIREWCGKHTTQSGKMMNWEQVRSLHQNKLFTIGGHTVNHPALGTQPKNIQQQEIVDGKLKLEETLNTKIDAFAYPHGNYNQDTLSIISNAKFKYAVTTEAKCVNHESKHFELPRFQVKNWTKEIFSNQLRQWQLKF